MNTFILSTIIAGGATFDVLLFFVVSIAVRTKEDL